MDVLILDHDFEFTAIVDSFESLIWTERYSQYGDFELYMRNDSRFIPYFVKGNYLMINESETIMMIEHVLMNSQEGEASMITISGRSLEAIVGKRIIWGQTTIQGSFQDGIKTLLEKNIISPTVTSRKISNFDFVPSTDSDILAKTIDTQFFGENLYDVISTLCNTEGIGFRISLVNKRFKFQLYKGEDRSFAQEKNPWVVFSPDYDNLESSTYEFDETNYANATLVIGEEEFSIITTENEEETTTTYPQMLIEVTLDDSTGLDRQEVFTDASGTSRTGYTEEGGSYVIPDAEYGSQLANKGLEELSEYSRLVKVDGQVDATVQFIYGKDFKMGDIVQVVNEYGMELRSQITEVIRSQDTNGYKLTPTFLSLEEGDE